MEIISQHTKAIMEHCKIRAREAGLSFTPESLEYIVTNRDMIELSPKVMIPTLYDYWVNDVEVLKGKGVYQVYPNNPYETVINSRPPISFYNDNNPDWLNIMIFYHVLGHIDFFQNNILFEKTWSDDFVGQALADKRLIANLRSEHGRWVDYIIEFSRGINNLVGYFDKLSSQRFNEAMQPSKMIEYYFSVFLQEVLQVPQHQLFNEVARFNHLIEQDAEVGESLFFAEVKKNYPEFEAKFTKHRNQKKQDNIDVMGFILDNSPFLKKEQNLWMKSVVSIVRNTELYFEPQIRTKIINEGWASYWHETLFIADERIKGHESAFAKINAGVTSISRVGLNPYAIGLRLLQYIEQLANKGKMNYNFQKLTGIEQREDYDKNTGNGRQMIFNLRKLFSDFTLINTFVNQDFVDQYDLFVVGKRYNDQRGTIEYYIKSRKARDYKQMLIDSLYDPPFISVDTKKTTENNLVLVHHFEGKQLYKEYIPDTLIGAEFLWGSQVQLETTEIHRKKLQKNEGIPEYENRKVVYTVKDRKVSKMYV